MNETPQQKSGWSPYLTYAAVVLPLAGAVGTIAWVQSRRPEPVPEPVVAVEPPMPTIPVVPPAPPELKPMGGMIDIKSTGKSRVSTVGPAPEPPEVVVTDPQPGRFGRAGGGRVYRGAPTVHTGGDTAPPPPSRSSSSSSSSREPGLTYRETVSSEEGDPLLPFGPRSSEGSNTSNRRFNRR